LDGEDMPEESNLDRDSKLKEIDTNSDSLPSSSTVDNTHIRPIQTTMNLYRSGITPEVISLQLDMGLEEVNKIIQTASIEEERKKISTKLVSEALSLSSFHLENVVDLTSAIRIAQSRVWRALRSKPEFTITFEETQLILEKFAESRIMLVVLHIDIVGSTRLSMMLPIDRLATIVRSFYQEMSTMISAYGGYVLKYVGDAILSFFVVSPDLHNLSLSCTNAAHCARSMIKVLQQGINPILSQYDYPEISVRIGIDVGENTVIQSGWDIHSKEVQTDGETDQTKKIISLQNSNFENDSKKEVMFLKKPIYDILGYTISITSKITAFAKPDQIVIGQLVYESLDKSQKSIFRELNINTEVWDYVSNTTGGQIYKIYGSISDKNQMQKDKEYG
jgi:adenylate cyclase